MPTPANADLQTIREALGAPDTNDWTEAMDAEIENTRRLNVLEVPRASDKNVITPNWASRHFHNGAVNPLAELSKWQRLTYHVHDTQSD